MNFTREPIIETIISPKEGCKLLVRSSRGGDSAEEHYVDAIEVVSFGHAFFFRSMERPKAFLVPVSDYEILEVKEPRVALKTSSHDRHIKIGGGREAPSREAPMRQGPREVPVEQDLEPAMAAEEEGSSSEEDVEGGTPQARSDKRRDRRRRRHRRSSDDQEWNGRRPQPQESSQSAESAPKAQGGGVEDEAKVSSPILPTLIPPPTTLISQTLSRYKGKEFMEGTPLSKEVKEEAKEEVKEEKKPEEFPGSDVTSLHRVAAEDLSLSSPLDNERNSYFF